MLSFHCINVVIFWCIWCILQPPAKTASVQPPDNKPVVDLTEADEESASTSQTASKPKLETVVTLPDTLSLKTLSNIEKLKQVRYTDSKVQVNK